MPDQERQPEDLRIPLHVEEVSVSRREIKTADIQIALVTGTRQQLIGEELTRVRVEVERVPIGRTIEVVPTISQEGRIASPEMFPEAEMLPHLICSRPIFIGGASDEADQHGGA